MASIVGRYGNLGTEPSLLPIPKCDGKALGVEWNDWIDAALEPVACDAWRICPRDGSNP